MCEKLLMGNQTQNFSFYKTNFFVKVGRSQMDPLPIKSGLKSWRLIVTNVI